MAGENMMFKTTIQALEDLNSHMYIAFAVNDGKVANDSMEATGIILNRPKNGEFAEIGYFGEMKFKAGGAISAGGKLTVTTSGYFTAAGSTDPNVGTCKNTVTSGSVGTGLFDFTRVTNISDKIYKSVTVTDAITAGKPVAFNDMKIANSVLEADAIAPAAISSGSTGLVILVGESPATLADSYGVGARVCVTTSGYFTLADSGYTNNAVVTTAANSGAQGAVFFVGGRGTELA